MDFLCLRRTRPPAPFPKGVKFIKGNRDTPENLEYVFNQKYDVVIDISGRPCFVFAGAFQREYVGKLPTELVAHFFGSFSQALGCSLHMKLHRGSNEHHKVEALFKGLGRSLRVALRDCPHQSAIPSTKGLL